MAGQGGQRRPVGTHCQLLNGSLLQAPVLRAFAICMPTGKYVLKCLLSPDVRQLATTSADKTIKLWNLDGFTLDRTLVGAPLHTPVLCVRPVLSWRPLKIAKMGGVARIAQYMGLELNLCCVARMQVQEWTCMQVETGRLAELFAVVDHQRSMRHCLSEEWLFPAPAKWSCRPAVVRSCLHPFSPLTPAAARSAGRPPAVGVGLRVFGGRGIPGHGVVRLQRAPVGPVHGRRHPHVQRPPQGRRLLRAERQCHRGPRRRVAGRCYSPSACGRRAVSGFM